MLKTKNIHLILALSILTSYVNAYGLDIPKTKEYIDLGTEGNLYPIVEPNFINQLKTGIKSFEKNITKKTLKQRMLSYVNKKAVGYTMLPFCQKANKRVSLNTYKIPTDIYNPLGRLIQKAGSKVVVNNKIPFALCYLAGNDMQIDNEIKFYQTISTKLGLNKCTFIIAGKNVLELDKRYKSQGLEFYPTNSGYEDTFNIKCYPSMVYLKDKQRFNFETQIGYFSHKENK